MATQLNLRSERPTIESLTRENQELRSRIQQLEQSTENTINTRVAQITADANARIADMQNAVQRVNAQRTEDIRYLQNRIQVLEDDNRDLAADRQTVRNRNIQSGAMLFGLGTGLCGLVGYCASIFANCIRSLMGR